MWGHVVGRNVDQLEEAMSKVEKELDPNKLRKVFSAIPGLVSHQLVWLAINSSLVA